MKIALSVLFTMVFLFTGLEIFGAGYQRTPWGSKSWSGSGVPPHWSGSPTPPPTDPPRPEFPSKPPVAPDWGQRPPHYGSGRWGRTHYYQRPSTATVVIEKEKEVPVYVTPVQRTNAPLRCGGRTMTSTDPQTGELIIEYVTGSQDCYK